MKFLFDFLGDLLSILGYLVYLEIIVLHFNKFDFNVKTNITRRSFIELNNNNEIDDSFNFDEGQEENKEEDLIIETTI